MVVTEPAPVRRPDARRRCRGDEAAALVEFAIVAPLLLLLVFGVIEFGWAFMQNLDVRHGAREGARLAAVDYSNDVNTIVQETCNRMDKKTTIAVAIVLDDIDSDGKFLAGDAVRVTVTKSPIDQLTNFFGWIFNGKDLTSTVTLRLEQDASYSSTGSPVACV